MLQFLYDRGKKIKRITLYVIRKHASCRKHQHLLILLQLSGHVIGRIEHTVHPRIIFLCKKVRNIVINEVGYLRQFL